MYDFEELDQNWMKLERPSKGQDEYMFIRLPKQSIPKAAATVFYNVQLVGYIPVIAKAESILEVKQKPLLLSPFIERGVLVHVDAANLLGLNGKSIRKTAIKLCKKGLVHFVLSTNDKKETRQSESILALSKLEVRFPADQVRKWKEKTAHFSESTEV